MKYTSLRALDARRFERPTRLPATMRQPGLLDLPGAEDRADGVRQWRAQKYADLSTLAALPAGLGWSAVAAPTGDAAARVALAPRAGSPDDAFAQLNALAREGALLRVAPGAAASTHRCGS